MHVGHVRLFRNAKKLGDELVVIINNDNWLRKKKRHVFMSEKDRKEIIQELACVDRVIVTGHRRNTRDMSVCADLKKIKPSIFANGGDRTKKNIPEVTTCESIGCKMVFNIGRGGKIQSSSWLLSKYLKEVNEQKPKVGIGVMIFKGGKVLLQKRKGSHGEGEYALPGGHLDYMEFFEDCARRETREECGVEIKNIKFQFLANVKNYAPKHYVHIGVIADWKAKEPKILEPKKSAGWGWYDLNKLPAPLFEMCKLAIDSYRTGSVYYDL